MLLICHFGGKAKRPSSAAVDSSDSEAEENFAARGSNANAVGDGVGGANTNVQR